MRFLPFVLKHLRRSWFRTTSTVLSMVVCIFLFCTLQTVLEAVNWSLKAASASRLVTRHAVSLVFGLPLSHGPKIRGVPGVRSAAVSNWFGGSLPARVAETSGSDFTNFFANYAVDAEPYLGMYPEYILAGEEKRAFLEDLRGCLIGRELARRFGWKVGDTFHLESFIPSYRRPAGPFEFVIRGIYDVDAARYPGADANLMLFHYRYLEEGTGRRVGALTYVVELADPAQAGVVSRAIDALFENSDAQTQTGTELAFKASLVSMAGDLTLLLNTIGLAVIFTVLLVTANTMGMSMRERRTEIAILKTLGFSGGLVMGLFLAEAFVIGIVGGALGVLLGSIAIKALLMAPFIGDAIRDYPRIGLSPQVGALGLAMALFIALGAGFVPALLAYRVRIPDLLRQP